MSTRVISDRELLHNLRFELDELRRGMAAVVERLERLESTLELDVGQHSRRVERLYELVYAVADDGTLEVPPRKVPREAAS